MRERGCDFRKEEKNGKGDLKGGVFLESIPGA